jgi:MFS family permease
MRFPPYVGEQLRLVRSPFGLLLLARALLVCASFGCLPYLTLLLTVEHRLSPAGAAVLLSVLAIANHSSTLPAGFAVDRLGTRVPLAATALTSMLCVVALALAPPGQQSVLGVLLAIQGACVTCHIACFRVSVPGLVPANRLAAGYGLSETARITGKLLGPATTMYFITVTEYRNAFVLAGLFYGFGGLCAAGALRRVRPATLASMSLPRTAREHVHLPWRLVGAALIVNVAANLALAQTTTWMPKYFVEIGNPTIPPLIFIASSALAAPLLVLVAPLFEGWSPNRLLLAAASGGMSLSLAFALVPWATAIHPLLPVAILVSGSLIAELTIISSGHVFVARIAPRRRLGLAFGGLGLSESLGGITGIFLGAWLYEQAAARGELATYWLQIGTTAAALVLAAYILKFFGDSLRCSRPK